MNTKQKTKTISLKKRRRSISRLPEWLQRIKGWLTARKGSAACDAEIERLRQRCLKAEHGMAKELERTLLPLHINSGVTWLKTTRKPEKADTTRSTDNPIALRAAEAMKSRNTAITSAAAQAKEEVIAIHETILSAESCFYQNVEFLRAFTTAKISAFITGVRSHKKARLGEYRSGGTVVFHGTAYSDYKEVHEANDRVREEFLNKLKGENSNEAL